MMCVSHGVFNSSGGTLVHANNRPVSPEGCFNALFSAIKG